MVYSRYLCCSPSNYFFVEVREVLNTILKICKGGLLVCCSGVVEALNPVRDETPAFDGGIK